MKIDKLEQFRKMPEVIKLKDLNEIDLMIIRKVSNFLTEGKVAILPTSTIYGLSCRFDNAEAAKRIYEIKHRDKNMPFIILISRREMLYKLAGEVSDTALRIIKEYWDPQNPQPLTLIFNKEISYCDPVSMVSGEVSSQHSTIAVRLAGIKFLSNLIDECGPIISTSANISGTNVKPGIITDIPPEIIKKVDLIVAYEGILPGIESTIVDVSGPVPVLVRKGAADFSAISYWH